MAKSRKDKAREIMLVVLEMLECGAVCDSETAVKEIRTRLGRAGFGIEDGPWAGDCSQFYQASVKLIGFGTVVAEHNKCTA